jgi:hypothetical protein
MCRPHFVEKSGWHIHIAGQLRQSLTRVHTIGWLSTELSVLQCTYQQVESVAFGEGREYGVITSLDFSGPGINA